MESANEKNTQTILDIQMRRFCPPPQASRDGVVKRVHIWFECPVRAEDEELGQAVEIRQTERSCDGPGTRTGGLRVRAENDRIKPWTTSTLLCPGFCPFTQDCGRDPLP